MSLCHIWLGVLRSKKRGFDGLDRVFFLRGLMSFSRCRVFRTVSGLVGRWKRRLNVCAMRLTPKAGCSRLSVTIWS
jgi:hypothetical protein